MVNPVALEEVRDPFWVFAALLATCVLAFAAEIASGSASWLWGLLDRAVRWCQTWEWPEWG